ncbi:MAG: HlyC/CorC family transporter [Clostridia bacterium]|nr:HlyC/CorC family transporter [Clostridia bacterium]
MTTQHLTQIIVIVVLVLMSGYFSATETAFSSLNKTRLKTLIEKGNRRAALTLALSEKYDNLLSTILIGNNIVNIAMSSISTLLFLDLLGDMGASVSTAVITVVVLIFGEISPKSIAKECPEKFAMFSAPIINFILIVLTPFNFLFAQWKKLLAKLFSLDNDTKMSQEELLMLVEEVQQDGSIDKTEGELLKNAIEFGDLEAKDILTHRLDLAAVAVTDSKEEIAKVFLESKFSRILVYDDSIDNIIGVLHHKDFYTESGVTDADIRDIMTPPIFVIKEVKIDLVLRELQKKKSHLAVVLDEYGGTYGVITMEDILDELVGELWTEPEENNENFKKLSDDLYRILASIDLDEFCEYFEIEIESDMVSFSGWITDRLEKIPTTGDQFEYEGMVIRVLSTDSHRVSEVEVRLTEDFRKEKEDEKENAVL